MSNRTPIVLTGATGYIGGSVLARLLHHSCADAFDITTLTRSTDKAKFLQSKFGVKAVVGTHEELDLVENLAETAHVFFNLAGPDNVPLIEAILRGMRKRHAKLGDLPILIHTSGTAKLIDDAKGQHSSDTIYDDLNVIQLRSIADGAPHRDVDLLIINADKQGYARTYMVLPSTIYGIADHDLAQTAVANRTSIQIPTLIKAAIARKRAGMVGEGKAIWPNVHIDDVADLYIVLFDSIIRYPDKTGHGWEGFYFGENGENGWYQISKAIGDALVKLEVIEDPEPTSFTADELAKYFGMGHERALPCKSESNWLATVGYPEDCAAIPRSVITSTLDVLLKAGFVQSPEGGFDVAHFVETAVTTLT